MDQEKRKKKRFGFKHILSILTFILVGLIIFATREDLLDAYDNLYKMNVWLLLLLIPMQIVMYFFAGNIYFSYIKAKQEGVKISLWKLMRISFELNFVNQILPSGGVSGMAYIAWRFKEFGLTTGRATMMQIFRYSVATIASVVLMSVASAVIWANGMLTGWILWLSVGICVALVLGVAGLLFIVSKEKRIDGFLTLIFRFINFVSDKMMFWRKDKKALISQERINRFLVELHREFDDVKKQPALLAKPFLWGLAYAFLDAMTFVVAFWALGITPNIWIIILAQGVASIVGTIAVTPGGAGFYEMVIIGYFVSAGVSLQIGLLATVTTRAIVLLGTIIFGWGFYQHALFRRKKRPIEVVAESLIGTENGNKA